MDVIKNIKTARRLILFECYAYIFDSPHAY